MKKLKIIIVTMLLSLASVFPVALPVTAHAQTTGPVNCGVEGQLDRVDCPSTGNGQSLGNVLKAVINVLSLIVGAVSVIMIIIGGFRYITSGGESSSVSGAKNTIIYAIIGLVIVVLAQIIVQFVLNKVDTAVS